MPADGEEGEEQRLQTWEQLCCGAVAGATGKTMLAPVDRVRILYQVSHSRDKCCYSAAAPPLSRSPGMYPSCLRRAPPPPSNIPSPPPWIAGQPVPGVHAVQGVQDLNRHCPRRRCQRALGWERRRTCPGHPVLRNCLHLLRPVRRVALTPSAMRPAGGLCSTSAAARRRFESALKPSRGQPVLCRFTAGAAAGATATALTYPLDLLRARQAAHWAVTPRYRGYVSGLQEIVRTEGPRALWAGLGPTLVGIVPYAGLSFGTYETLKAMLPRDEQTGQLPSGYRLAAGGLAGLVAQTATYPLHVVRRRMQVQEGAVGVAGGVRYASAWEAFGRIYAEEGLRQVKPPAPKTPRCPRRLACRCQQGGHKAVTVLHVEGGGWWVVAVVVVVVVMVGGSAHSPPPPGAVQGAGADVDQGPSCGRGGLCAQRLLQVRLPNQARGAGGAPYPPPPPPPHEPAWRGNTLGWEESRLKGVGCPSCGRQRGEWRRRRGRRTSRPPGSFTRRRTSQSGQQAAAAAAFRPVSRPSWHSRRSRPCWPVGWLARRPRR